MASFSVGREPAPAPSVPLCCPSPCVEQTREAPSSKERPAVVGAADKRDTPLPCPPAGLREPRTALSTSSLQLGPPAQPQVSPGSCRDACLGQNQLGVDSLERAGGGGHPSPPGAHPALPPEPSSWPQGVAGCVGGPSSLCSSAIFIPGETPREGGHPDPRLRLRPVSSLLWAPTVAGQANARLVNV